jgi:hypothetical protein
MPVQLLVELPSGQANLFRVNHDYAVAMIRVRRKIRAGLSRQNVRGLRRQPP